jgi:serine/threonine protein kinase
LVNSLTSPIDLKSRYRANHMIGCGTFSWVMHATDTFSKGPVALKRVDLNASPTISPMKAAEIAIAELDAFKRVGRFGPCPFIVNLHSAYHTKTSCFLAMDYLGGGDLRRLLKMHRSMSEDCVAYLVGCIGSALHHLHSRGVIHRDLKPENIAFDLLGRPHLTDFGISVVSTDENPLPICSSSSGTLLYLAPEVLTPSNRHSHQSDFWSLGVIAYELAVHQRPFEKHCPPSFIQFSSNEYSSMWTSLELAKSSATNLDFEKTHEASGNLSHISHSSELNEDGSVPDSLQVTLPSQLSDEMRAMLNGLLDVRVPQRLGSISRFSLFSDHPLFFKINIVLSHISSLVSPFVLLIEPLPLFANHTFFEDFESPLPTQVEKKLSDYHFRSPTTLEQKVNQIHSRSLKPHHLPLLFMKPS